MNKIVFDANMRDPSNSTLASTLNLPSSVTDPVPPAPARMLAVVSTPSHGKYTIKKSQNEKRAIVLYGMHCSLTFQFVIALLFSLYILKTLQNKFIFF